jgi:hypothetical protein
MTSATSRLSNNIVSSQNVSNINLVNTLGISLNKNLIFQYWGGPGSVYGVGTTTIKRAVDTTKLSSVNAMTYDQLANQVSNFKNPNPVLRDFRTQLSGAASSGSWSIRDTTDYRFFVNKKDRLNLLYPFAFNNNSAPWETAFSDDTSSDDLIKFVFEAISNDNPSVSTAIFFRAFLTAGITDNNTAVLNPFRYMGRGENFYTYQGFDRSISFAFRVAAASKDEIRPMYNRVNALMSQVYPDYSSKQGIMRAPIVKVTIGDYLYRVPGFLESVNITVDNNYPWEVNLEKSEIGDIAQLPQLLDISISFKPIMDVLPRRTVYLDAKTETISNTQEIGTVTTTDTFYEANTTPLIADTNKGKPGFIKDLKENSRIRTSVSITPTPTSNENVIDQRTEDFLDEIIGR